jgi:hypothetical protein
VTIDEVEMFLRCLTNLFVVLAVLCFANFDQASAQNTTAKEDPNFLPDFGPLPSRDSVVIEIPKPFESAADLYALEDALIAALAAEATGKFDGTLRAVDGSSTLFYIYTENVEKAANTLSTVLLARGYSNEVMLELITNQKDGTSITIRQTLH